MFDCWGLRPQTPETAPPLQICSYAPANYYITTLTHVIIKDDSDIFLKLRTGLAVATV